MKNYILVMNELVYSKIPGGYSWIPNTAENMKNAYVMTDYIAHGMLKLYSMSFPENDVYLMEQ